VVDEAKVRASVEKQLAAPLPRLLSMVEEPQTLAEQHDRVSFAERCLWGASIVMSSIGLTQRHRPAETPNDPLEVSWWMLYDHLEAIRGRWHTAEREKFDADRDVRRRRTWDEVMAKMAEQGMPWNGVPYALEAQSQWDAWPQIRYEFDARWAHERGRLEVRDPFTGDWLNIDSKDAPNGWKALARANRERERG
jgi:hypothetical protein